MASYIYENFIVSSTLNKANTYGNGKDTKQG
jgi:hypothetical protein